MAKATVQNAVFFKDSKKPKCPKCQYSLEETVITDYGVEDDKIFFVSNCKLCEKPTKYFTGKDDEPIKTKIAERKNNK